MLTSKKKCVSAMTGGVMMCFAGASVAQENRLEYQSGFNDYVLLVYEDTECPACAASFDDTAAAVESLGITMERVIFPVTTGRLESEIEGMLSHCFRKILGTRHQDALVKILHRTNLTDAKTMIEQLSEHAPEYLGGRMGDEEEGKVHSTGKADEILACTSNPEDIGHVEESIKMGFRYEVNGTPTYQLLNWKTLGNGSVTGVPNTVEALAEWIATTAQLTDEIAPTDEFEIEEFLELNPVLRPIYDEYRKGRPGPESENVNSADDVKQVIQDVLKGG